MCNACCLLRRDQCVLCVVRCVGCRDSLCALFVVCCSLFVVCCVWLFGARCRVLSVACYLSFAAVYCLLVVA